MKVQDVLRVMVGLLLSYHHQLCCGVSAFLLQPFVIVEPNQEGGGGRRRRGRSAGEQQGLFKSSILHDSKLNYNINDNNDNESIHNLKSNPSLSPSINDYTYEQFSKTNNEKTNSNTQQMMNRRGFSSNMMKKAAVSSMALLVGGSSWSFPANTVAAATTTTPSSGSVESKSALIGVANSYLVKDKNSKTDTSSSSSSSIPSMADPLDDIDWNVPKRRNLNMEQLADAINDGLVEQQWFVTGRGKPEYFSENFVFDDPQVSLVGFESYCRGVRRIFDQQTSKCEVICCSVTGEHQLTILWRNSGTITLGPILSVKLKPYLVTTRLETDPKDGNLIVAQTDEFENDALGILLYQIPFLRPLAGPVAPSAEILKQQCDFQTCRIVS